MLDAQRPSHRTPRRHEWAWARRGSQDGVQGFDRRSSHPLGGSCAPHGRPPPGVLWQPGAPRTHRSSPAPQSARRTRGSSLSARRTTVCRALGVADIDIRDALHLVEKPGNDPFLERDVGRLPERDLDAIRKEDGDGIDRLERQVIDLCEEVASEAAYVLQPRRDDIRRNLTAFGGLDVGCYVGEQHRTVLACKRQRGVEAG